MERFFITLILVYLINNNYNVTKNESSIENKFLINLILFSFIYLIFGIIFKTREDFADINDSGLILPKLGICSSKCCPSYYPSSSLPIDIDSRIKPGDIGTKYFTSNLFCSDGVRNRGCVCINKDAKEMLNRRGYYKYDNNNDFLGTDKNKMIQMMTTLPK